MKETMRAEIPTLHYAADLPDRLALQDHVLPGGGSPVGHGLHVGLNQPLHRQRGNGCCRMRDGLGRRLLLTLWGLRLPNQILRSAPREKKTTLYTLLNSFPAHEQYILTRQQLM